MTDSTDDAAVHVVEFLAYQLVAGSGAAFDAIMQNISLPLHAAAGVNVILSRPSLHDEDRYMLIRSFASEQSRASQLDGFYASDAWRNGPRVAIITAIETSTEWLMLMSDAAIEQLRR